MSDDRIVEFTRIGLYEVVEPLELSLTTRDFITRVRNHADRYLAADYNDIKVTGSPDQPTGTLHVAGEQVGEFTVRIPN